MRGGGGVVVWHQVAVVRHKVALQFVKVLNRQRQEELDPAEDVQQHLRSADNNIRGQLLFEGGGSPEGEGLTWGGLTWSFLGSTLTLFTSLVFPLLWTFSLFFTCTQTQHTSLWGHMTGGGGHVTISVPS